jgi:type I restriction enzyme M protein
MNEVLEGADRLVSRAEVATLAGVRRPAVTNWQRRHEDFPRTVGEGEPAYFRLGEVVEWLAERVIPPNARRDGERSGVTYADRVREVLRRQVRTERVDGVRQVPVEPTDARPCLPELMRLAGRIQGPADGTAYLDLIVSLVFLRRCVPARWREVRSAVAVPDASGTALLHNIGQWVDEELRRRVLVGRMRGSLASLAARAMADVAQVVRLSSELRRDEVADLLDRYTQAGRLTIQESRTPSGVATLMARALLAGPRGDWRVVYDPYTRSGELLTAVVSDLDPRPTVYGASPRSDTLALAGINLAIEGVDASLRTTSVRPWLDRDRRPAADLVVVNPPFNATGAGDDPAAGTWAYGAPPPGNDNYAWVQHVLASLKPGGRAAVLLPNKATVSTVTSEQEIRRALVRRGALEGVIALPAQLFAGTPIPACVLLLRHPTDRQAKVLFIDARGRGRRVGPLRVLDDGDLVDIEQALHAHRDPHRDPPAIAGFVAVCDLTRALTQGCSIYPPDYITTQAAAPDIAAAAEREREARAAVDAARSRAHYADYAADEIEVDITTDPWSQAPVNELCDVHAGPSHTWLKGKVFEGGEVPVVLPKHVRARRILAGGEGVSPDVAYKLARFQLAPGDIVCVRSGAAGQAAMVDASQAGWLASTNLLRLHNFRENLVDPDYLLAYLSRPHVLKWITDRAQATVIPFINGETLGQLVVALPPLHEQRRIAAALRTADEQIAAHRDLADALDAHRAALGEQLMSEPVSAT